jgi:hypothetical protein
VGCGRYRNCTFKDVLFRVDARLELPRGTLLEHEHKRIVKKRIKGLLVSLPSLVPPCASMVLILSLPGSSRGSGQSGTLSSEEADLATRTQYKRET